MPDDKMESKCHVAVTIAAKLLKIKQTILYAKVVDS